MQTPYPRHDQRRMPGWVIALIIAPLALCVTCASVGYFVVVPRVRGGLENSREAISNQIADSVFMSLADRIESHPDGTNLLLIRPIDLNVNNAEIPGEVGVQWGTDGARLWGIDTQISPTGLALIIGDVATYSGIPRIAAGQVELTNVVIERSVPLNLLTEDGFASGMAQGINRALAAHALIPTAITLGNGQLTIAVAPHTEHDLHREPILAA